MAAPVVAANSMATASLDLTEVERRLAAAIAASPTRTRASTLNLICSAESDDEARALAGELATLARRHPGRMLLIVPALAGGDQAAREWRARILDPGTPAPGGGICGEIVQLEAAGTALLSASMALAPLLLGDVPVFLWWRGEDPFANPRFDDLAGIADRILLDCHGLACEPAAFLRLAESQRQVHHRAKVSDLTWTRLARWRQMVAQAFESSAAARHMRCLTEAEFESSRGLPALNGAALLLAGWLTARLGWRPTRRLSAAELELTTPQGGALRIRFRRGEREDSGFLLGSVALRSGEGLAATVTRSGDKIKLDLQSGEAALARSTVIYPMATLIDALRFELDHLHPDPCGEQAAVAAAELMRVLGNARA